MVLVDDAPWECATPIHIPHSETADVRGQTGDRRRESDDRNANATLPLSQFAIPHSLVRVSSAPDPRLILQLSLPKPYSHFFISFVCSVSFVVNSSTLGHFYTLFSAFSSPTVSEPETHLCYRQNCSIYRRGSPIIQIWTVLLLRSCAET